MKIDKIFQLKIVIFTPVKNRCMLHGCVFCNDKNKIEGLMCALAVRISVVINGTPFESTSRCHHHTSHGVSTRFSFPYFLSSHIKAVTFE